MKDLYSLPKDLPVPQDDGACAHLLNFEIPSIVLESTEHRLLDLNHLTAKPTVFFFYPRTGEAHRPTPEGWDLIPGARGCTPQSCGYRDLYQSFLDLGYQIFGVSTQATDYQKEFVARNHIPFEILSDKDFILTKALNLPTFNFNEMLLLKRMAWIVEHGKIIQVFYPVFPPNENATVVLEWLKANRNKTTTYETF
jgi:peroxiredoxin